MIDFGSMTFAQAKEYCRKFRHSHSAPCEDKGCELRRRRICMDWVHEWDFDRLTPEELDICRAISARFVSMSDGANFVKLWDRRPRLCYGDYVCENDSGYADPDVLPIAVISADRFPRVQP